MYTPHLSYLAAVSLLAPLLLTACGDDDDEVVIANQTSAFIAATPTFSRLDGALDEASRRTLDAQGQLTLFAPNDAAFAAADLAGLPADLPQDVLLYHALGGIVLRSEDIAPGLRIFNNAQLSTPSLLVQRSSDGIRVNDARVVTPDLFTANGIVHEIDAVLTLPTAFDLATYLPSLSSFVATIRDAGLADTLRASIPDGITVLAPTDAAFLAAGPTLAGLSAEERSEVLQYHIVPGVALSRDLLDGRRLTTLRGRELTVWRSGNDIRLIDERDNAVAVEVADLRGTNGVVHGIAGVLLTE